MTNMPPSSSRVILRLLSQVAVGVVFLYAGGQKIFVSGVMQFASDVENFRLLPESMVPLVAYFLPWWEMVTGLCLILSIQRKGAIVSGLLMTLLFFVVIFWAWSQGLDLSCGCFGKTDAAIHYPRKIFELSLQMTALLIAASGSTAGGSVGDADHAEMS